MPCSNFKGSAKNINLVFFWGGGGFLACCQGAPPSLNCRTPPKSLRNKENPQNQGKTATKKTTKSQKTRVALRIIWGHFCLKNYSTFLRLLWKTLHKYPWKQTLKWLHVLTSVFHWLKSKDVCSQGILRVITNPHQSSLCHAPRAQMLRQLKSQSPILILAQVSLIFWSLLSVISTW